MTSRQRSTPNRRTRRISRASTHVLHACMRNDRACARRYPDNASRAFRSIPHMTRRIDHAARLACEIHSLPIHRAPRKRVASLIRSGPQPILPANAHRPQDPPFHTCDVPHQTTRSCRAPQNRTCNLSHHPAAIFRSSDVFLRTPLHPRHPFPLRRPPSPPRPRLEQTPHISPSIPEIRVQTFSLSCSYIYIKIAPAREWFESEQRCRTPPAAMVHIFTKRQRLKKYA
jgi:hypothetical protein